MLRVGTFVLLLSVFLAPTFELFDRWDAPGLCNDTEMAVFGLVLLLCLALAVWEIVSSLADQFSDVVVAILSPERSSPLHLEQAFGYKLIVPPITAPLTI